MSLPVNSTDVRLRVSVTGAFHPLLFHITLPLEHCTPWLCVVFIRWWCNALWPPLYWHICVHFINCVRPICLCASWHTCPPPQRANNQCLWCARDAECRQRERRQVSPTFDTSLNISSNFIPGLLLKLSTPSLARDKIKKCDGAWANACVRTPNMQTSS